MINYSLRITDSRDYPLISKQTLDWGPNSTAKVRGNNPARTQSKHVLRCWCLRFRGGSVLKLCAGTQNARARQKIARRPCKHLKYTDVTPKYLLQNMEASHVKSAKNVQKKQRSIMRLMHGQGFPTGRVSKRNKPSKKRPICDDLKGYVMQDKLRMSLQLVENLQ